MLGDAHSLNAEKFPFSPGPKRISKLGYSIPVSATDCYFHISGPRDQYPLSAGRTYNPEDASGQSVSANGGHCSIDRMVIIQASPYATDNRCLMDSIALLGAERTRGIAVIDIDILETELERMHGAGVYGISFNATSGGASLDDLDVLSARIAPFSWHVQLWIKGERISALEKKLLKLPLQFSIDHLVQISPKKGIWHPEFQSVLKLL